MKFDPKLLNALCEEIAQRLGVPCVILISVDPGDGTGFSVYAPEGLAREVPPTLWMLGDHFCAALGLTPDDYVDDDAMEEGPAGGDVRKH